MSIVINVKLNVKKIEKDRLYIGDKGTYLDAAIILFEEPDKFGNDGMIVQNVSKEERTAGKKGTILGNVRYAKKDPIEKPVKTDDLPF